MVSDKVEIVTRSYKEGSKTMHWTCDGSPEYTMEEASTERSRGTDVILHLSEDSKEFADKARIREILKKYCSFLPVPIAFGKKQEWKDGKYVDTDQDDIVNATDPLWTKKPTDITEEDYMEFYRTLYPMAEDPLFYIHLNIDYPFNLTGIPLFPEDTEQFRDSEEQNTTLFESGVRDRFGRRDRAGVPDPAARRDRLAGHPAERIAKLPAERLER